MPNRDGTGPDGKGLRTGRRGRPRLQRCVQFDPDVTFFKPQGIPVSELDVVDLSVEEIEALRLKNMQKLDQRECAKAMKTSPATAQRILSSAYSKITSALVEGKAIRIFK